VFINSIMYGSSEIYASPDASLKYENSYIKINFVGITFQQPKKVLYRYRMLGLNRNWILNTSGSVDYSSIPPGDYTFEVIAKKIDSDWSTAASYHFTIRRPFWMTSWFIFLAYASMFTFVGSGIFYLRKSQRRKKYKKLKEQDHIVELEQKALNALMNPHFIFNALNSIQQYIFYNDTESAVNYLSLFAKLTRKNLDAMMKKTVTLHDELERLDLYLKFEKLRFGHKLQYEIQYEPDLDPEEIYLPPMVLQPFVENAIWHGVMTLPEGGLITIKVEVMNEAMYKIEITDPGTGFESVSGIKNSERFSHASESMQLTLERLKYWVQMRKTLFELKIEANDPGADTYKGTKVILVLPM
jgi:hypothetical protein